MSDRPDSVHNVTFGKYGWNFGHPADCQERHCDTFQEFIDDHRMVGLAAKYGTYELYISTVTKYLVLGVPLK